MEGKVALVTGSTSGIGLGISRALAKRGCDVILTGFGTTEEIETIKSDIVTKYKVSVNYVSADLTKKADIDSLCSQVAALYPNGIHILVNNAGFNRVGLVENYPSETWHEMMAVMLEAPFHLIKYFIPVFKGNGWGRIVNMSSTHGMISTPGKAVYSAVKHGIIGLTKGVALETAEYGITCNAVCPTFVHTPLLDIQMATNAATKGQTLDEAKHDFEKMVPTKKLIQIDQVAESVAFLCSEPAAAITGSCLTVDGGYLAQ